MVVRNARPRDAVLLQSGLDHLDQGVAVFDDRLRLIGCNRQAVELLGIPEELAEPGTDFAELVRWFARRGDYGLGDIETMVERRVAAARQCLRHYSERRGFHRKILASQTTPLPGGGFVIVVTDISERSQAEALTPERSDELEARVNHRTQELRVLNDELRRKIRQLQDASVAQKRSEERLRLITDAIPAAIAYVDDQLTVTFSNKRFAQIFDLSGAEILGRNVGDLFQDRDGASVIHHVVTALQGKEESFSHITRSGVGVKRITRNVLIPEFAENGAVPGIFVLALDVTEEKQAEAAFRNAQKMSAIGQLAGGMAHDFNNLLTIIAGNLSLLQDQMDQETFAGCVEPALRASRRGMDITRRLLAFARRQSLEPTAIEPRQLIAGIILLLRRSVPANIAIESDETGPVWAVRADPNQLENALVNLALNARDAMPEGGVLHFRTSNVTVPDGADHGDALVPGDYVQIDVIDNGVGLDPASLDRVFEPFFTTKPFGAGSGLGLSMVYGFVRQSGGQITVASARGQGTSFSMLLPRAEEEAAVEEAAPDPPATPGRGELILLIEDNDDVRLLVRRQLLDLGYQVLEARNGEEGRSLLDTVADIQCMVSDIVMPGPLSGYALARHARRLHPEMRVVLISGFAEAAPQRYPDEEDWPLLRKPFSKNQLGRVLQGEG